MINKDMIKALRCVASQNVEGDCYADMQNFLNMDNKNYKELVCRSGENLKSFINGKDAIECPYHQEKYGVCFEDGDLFWLEETAEKLKRYEALEEQGRLIEIPCSIGDTVYSISCETIYPFTVNGFRINEYEVEFTAPYCGEEKRFSNWTICFPISNFGKTVFLTEEEAKQALADMQKG